MKILLFRLPLLAALLTPFLPVAAQAVAPPNDNFASRMVLTGQAVSSVPVAVNDATREGLESANTLNQTVWYTWTAPQDGTLTLTGTGTTYGARISVYNGGTLANLVLIVNDDNAGTNGAGVSFNVKAGFAYQLCIGAYNQNVTGTAVLNLVNKATTITAPVVVAVPAGTNDNFTQAVALTGPVTSAFTYPLSATRETQEPSYTSNQTVWWTWTAPGDALVTMNTAGSNSLDDNFLRRVLNVFDGTALTNLTLVAGSRGSLPTVSFPVKAGRTFYVCVGSESTIGSGLSEIVTSVLNITTSAFPITAPVSIQSLASANDNFANAQDLGSSAVVAGFGFNYDATRETLEPTSTGNHTLWWTWTAPQDGKLTCSAAGTTFNHLFIPGTGGSLTTLANTDFTPSARFFNYATPSQPLVGTLTVAAGTTYHFVLGSDGGTGTAVLNLAFVPGASHVSLTADAPIVHKPDSSVAYLTLTRDGDVSKQIVVNYTEKMNVDGTVQTLTGMKKMKAGKGSVKIKLPTVGDYNKTVLKLTLTAGSDYVVGTPAKAKVTLLGN